MWGPSVCLSFSPKDENPDLRAVQLRAHYLPNISFYLVPFSLQQGLSLGVSRWARRGGSPLCHKLCLGKCLVWASSGELAEEKPLVGRHEVC